MFKQITLIINFIKRNLLQLIIFVILNIRIFFFSKKKISKNLKKKILFFLEKRKKEKFYKFTYSSLSENPDLYSSVYSLMITSIIDENLITRSNVDLWFKYFNEHQSSEDGLFYDPKLNNEIYRNYDWWGSRHLLAHILNLYARYKKKPKYEFKFLKIYKNYNFLDSWINKYQWDYIGVSSDDFDNKLMNICTALQFERDYLNIEVNNKFLNYIKQLLKSKINNEIEIWGNNKNKTELSRSVQFSYHLLTIFFYDGYYNFDLNKMADTVLKTQNKFGGYGLKNNSSACEDIDSIYILIKIYPYVNEFYQNKISKSLIKSYKWLLLNQNKDGGFSFRYFERHKYGHNLLKQDRLKSSMFSTWFRLLTIGYIINFFEKKSIFKLGKFPGYEN